MENPVPVRVEHVVVDERVDPDADRVVAVVRAVHESDVVDLGLLLDLDDVPPALPPEVVEPKAPLPVQVQVDEVEERLAVAAAPVPLDGLEEFGRGAPDGVGGERRVVLAGLRGRGLDPLLAPDGPAQRPLAALLGGGAFRLADRDRDQAGDDEEDEDPDVGEDPDPATAGAVSAAEAAAATATTPTSASTAEARAATAGGGERGRDGPAGEGNEHERGGAERDRAGAAGGGSRHGYERVIGDAGCQARPHRRFHASRSRASSPTAAGSFPVAMSASVTFSSTPRTLARTAIQ